MLRLPLVVACVVVCLLVDVRGDDLALQRDANGGIIIPASALTDKGRSILAGFTYDLPDGWTLKTVPGVANKMAFGRQMDGNPANISFQDITFDGNLAELESKTLKESAAAFSAKGLTNFKVINMSAFETASQVIGLQAVTEAQRQDRRIVRQFFYFFEHKDGKKICVVCSVADEGTAYDAEFDMIMKTFRLTR